MTEINKMIMLLTGIVFLIVGIWLFFNMLKDSRTGYKDGFGNDIKVYLGSSMVIILGVVFVFKSLF
jgi:hypothetical protein